MDITALELLFRDMYESLSELSLVLDNEYTALSEQNVENLQQAAIDKDRLSDKLDELEKNRYHILEHTSFNLDRISMQLFIQQNFPGHDHALLKLWDMIAELAKADSYFNCLDIIHYGSAIIDLGSKYLENRRMKLLRELNQLRPRVKRCRGAVNNFSNRNLIAAISRKLQSIQILRWDNLQRLSILSLRRTSRRLETSVETTIRSTLMKSGQRRLCLRVELHT